MVGVILIAHGHLAEELLATAEMIAGPISRTRAIGVLPRDTMEDIRTSIQHTMEEVNSGHGVLILTDMFGGTPCNVSLTFLEEGKVEVVSGMNLPMLLKIATSRASLPTSLPELARSISQYGRRNIAPAGDMLRGRVEEERR